jgi:Flp pilus assembly protein TadD
VALREALLGPEHPTVARDLAALAAIVSGRGRFDEAERLLRRAIALMERAYGPNLHRLDA